MTSPTEPDNLADVITTWRDAYVDRLREIQELRTRLRKLEERTHQDNTDLFCAILNVIDHFDGTSGKIEQALTDADAKARKVLKSFQVLRKQLAASLKPVGVTPMNMDSDEFVAGLHKVVAVEEADDRPEGHIVRVVKPGYFWNQKILRSAEVVICGQPETES